MGATERTGRPTQAQRRIKPALAGLLERKSLQTLTVSEIARAAGINRGTFYLHYADKFDLLQELENEAIEGLAGILLTDSGETVDDPLALIPYPVILRALQYIKGDFVFIHALLGPNGDPLLVDRIKVLLQRAVDAQVARSVNLHHASAGFPADYAAEILLSGIVSIVLLWIRKGAAEPPEQIASMVSRAKRISPYELLQ